jgi:hypothetical protein
VCAEFGHRLSYKCAAKYLKSVRGTQSPSIVASSVVRSQQSHFQIFGIVVSSVIPIGIQDAISSSSFLGNKSCLMNQRKGRIMNVIIRSPESQLEEVVLECPDLTWNQVFCELDRMSRAGQVQLTMKGPGLYAVSHLSACNSLVYRSRKER